MCGRNIQPAVIGEVSCRTRASVVRCNLHACKRAPPPLRRAAAASWQVALAAAKFAGLWILNSTLEISVVR